MAEQQHTLFLNSPGLLLATLEDLEEVLTWSVRELLVGVTDGGLFNLTLLVFTGAIDLSKQSRLLLDITERYLKNRYWYPKITGVDPHRTRVYGNHKLSMNKAIQFGKFSI